MFDHHILPWTDRTAAVADPDGYHVTLHDRAWREHPDAEPAR